MLKVFDLNKKYGKTKACDGVSFSLEKGSVTVLLGPNGAGKSTVIKSIVGFLRYSGDIKVAGLNNKSVEAKRLLGYVPEIPALYPNLTVSEHMEFIARAYKLKDYKPYIDELFDRFELSDKRKKFGDELSKGMQQKLSVCCALVHNPKVIIFDEPMVGLDPHAIKELKEIFKELKQSGASVLISTHMLDSVESCWDKAYIMVGGEIKAETAEERKADKSLE